ncbi:hypothetical protein Y032_0008g64 [Ancylostoma ceylanicum]|uniref:Uncharacterized protein n=1 Tax=Ancylostoma ceylanicum TaxID=53326 RepID=A0A016VMK2_9BILA|nr:hypothetical protein Y032_0008g64 [Ancylostoma ceylanicum]
MSRFSIFARHCLGLNLQKLMLLFTSRTINSGGACSAPMLRRGRAIIYPHILSTNHVGGMQERIFSGVSQSFPDNLIVYCFLCELCRVLFIVVSFTMALFFDSMFNLYVPPNAIARDETAESLEPPRTTH